MAFPHKLPSKNGCDTERSCTEVKYQRPFTYVLNDTILTYVIPFILTYLQLCLYLPMFIHILSLILTHYFYLHRFIYTYCFTPFVHTQLFIYTRFIYIFYLYLPENTPNKPRLWGKKRMLYLPWKKSVFCK